MSDVGWTLETLKTYYDQRFIDTDKAVAAALAAAEKATEKAETNAERWRASANEWRQAMNDREAKFPSRVEIEAEMKALRAEVGSLRDSIRTEIASLRESRAEGAGGKAVWATIIGLILALVAAVIAPMLNAGKAHP